MGGGDIGLGHVRRSLTLYEAARGYGLEVEFHCNDHPTVKSMLAGVAHSARAIDVAVSNSRPDVILWDQRDTPAGELGRVRALAGCPVLALDYFRYDDDAVDRVLNLYHHAREQLAHAGRPERFREGVDLAIVRPEFQPHRKENKAAALVERILVTFGGSDPAGNTAVAIRALADAGYAEATLDVVLGPDAALAADATDGWRGSVDVRRSVDDMPASMARADFACTGGGTTLLEACYVGLPCAVFPQTERERAHAAAIAALGAARCVAAGAADAAELLAGLSAADARQAIADSGRELVDGRGGERILYELVALARAGR